MNPFPTTMPHLTLRRLITAALLLCLQWHVVAAEPAASLLPTFGPEGRTIDIKAQKDKPIKGWLPNGWDDNSEWAPISVIYSKLTDAPDKSATALRIEVKDLEEGRMQLTSYSGVLKYQKGTDYKLTGWIRSAKGTSVIVGARQIGDPYEFYHETELATTAEWKAFEFKFTPEKEFEAIMMFAIQEASTVDLAGVRLTSTKTMKSLLPLFGQEGEEFTSKAAGDHTIKGWLPAGWIDNSAWASVSATYSKLADAPDKGVGALRIKVEKLDEGQLQFTTFAEHQKYTKGISYQVSGWVKSSTGTGINVGARQIGEPYEFYHEQELTAETGWKPFTFGFKPEKDIEALIMFVVRQAGTVDLAGVVVETKP